MPPPCCERVLALKVLTWRVCPPHQVDDPWTPENELLTAAMKLKRKPICDRHKAELDKLYK